MWYFVLSSIAIIYVLINLLIPGAINSVIATYVIQPILWISLAILTLLIAGKEGVNIWQFKKERRWHLGNSPVQTGILIGGFQISLLIIGGLITGFGKNPNVLSPISTITTIIFIGSFLLGTEVSRSYLIKTGARAKKYLTLTLFLTTLLYMLLKFSPNDFFLLDFSNQTAVLEFIGGSLIVALCISLLASYLAFLGGATASMSYMGILLAFQWFSPILPRFHWTIAALVGTIAPTIGFIIIQSSLASPTKKRKHHRVKHKESDYAGWITAAIFSLIIVFFSFGYLGVTPTVIYSGSMQPALNVGDIALVSDVDIDELTEGEIIQYVSYDNVTLTLHRLIKMYKEGGQMYFITKGDANDDPDFEPITENRITGKSIFTIPKLGWIQIFIRNTFKNIGIQI